MKKIILFLMGIGLFTLISAQMVTDVTTPENEGSSSAALLQSEYFVDFEGPGETKTTYSAGVVNLNGKDWNLDNVLIGTDANDMKNGARSARFRHQDDNAATMTLLEDKANGLGSISFVYARSNFSGDRQPTAPIFVVEYSLDEGVEWTQIGNEIDLAGVDELSDFTETVNVEGFVRVRFRSISGTDGRRFNVDDILLTDFGDEDIVARPTFDPPAGSYYEPISVTISTTTEDATIHYTTDNTDPTQDSPVFDPQEPLQVSENVTIKARAFKEEWTPSMIATANYQFIQTVEVATLSELRAGQQDDTLYRLTGEVILTFQQSFRNQKYIQDDTAAILIDDDTGVITTIYSIGDGITNMTGTLGEFGNMLQFIPAADPGPASSSGNVIMPAVISADDFDGNYSDYDAQLLTIRNVTFLDADGNIQFENGSVYPITDETATIDFRATFYNVDYIGTTLPQEPVDLTGLANARTTFPEGFFISARSSADITEALPENTVATPSFTPPGGQYVEPVNVTITTLTEDASIYYTIDGTEPTQNAILYTEPIHVSEETTLRARAFKEGMNPSNIATAVYQIGFTRIKDIRDNFAFYNGMRVTVQGVVTIGSGTIHLAQLRAYIQDDPIIHPIEENNRGVMLFDFNADPNIQRGHKLLVTGTVGEYQGVVQLTDIDYEIIETGIDIEPYIIELSIVQAQNYQEWEGTMVEVQGTLYEEPFFAGGGYNVNIQDEAGTRLTVRVWDSTGIDVARLTRGVPIRARGAVGVFANRSQILPGYQDDIIIDIAEPVIDDIFWEPENPFVGVPYVDDPITIKAIVFDYDGEIESVELTYKLESVGVALDTLVMNFIGNDTYSADIPSLDTYTDWEDNYIIELEATDDDGNVTRASKRIPVLQRRPIVHNVNLASPIPGDSLGVTATVITPALEPEVEITEVRLFYYLNYRAQRYEAEMEPMGNDIYQGYIPGQPEGTIVEVVIFAEDNVGLFTEQRYDDDDEEIIYTYPVSTHQAMLRIPPRPFNPWDGETISIGFFSEAGNKAILRIYNAEGKLMYTPKNLILAEQDGINYYHWNGKDLRNHIMPIGLYICHLEVIDTETGNKKTATAPIVIGSPLK